MTVENAQKSWVYGEVVVAPVVDRTTVKARIEGKNRRVTVLTPNLAIASGLKPTDSPTYFYKDQINFDLAALSATRLVGGSSRLAWKAGTPEEDARYAEYERGELNHPFVGMEMLAYMGTTHDANYTGEPGVGSDFRIERRTGRDGREFFVTTNAIWTRVRVVDGFRKEMHGNSRPKLTVVSVGEKEAKPRMIYEDDLRFDVESVEPAILALLDEAKESRHGFDHARALLLKAGINNEVVMSLLLFGVAREGDFDHSRVVTQEEAVLEDPQEIIPSKFRI